MNKVLRGGDWIVIGDIAYSLRALASAAYVMVCDAGSDNPGFDMPNWFYTGSPYAAQIIGLGISPESIPCDFVPEIVPDLGRVWRSRRPLWECYTAATTLDVAPVTLAEAARVPEIASLVEWMRAKTRDIETHEMMHDDARADIFIGEILERLAALKDAIHE